MMTSRDSQKKLYKERYFVGEGHAVPKKHAILSGRGHTANNNEANQEFRRVIAVYSATYHAAKLVEKRNVCKMVLKELKEEKGYCFMKLRREDGLWYDMSEKDQTRKIQQTFRDVKKRTIQNVPLAPSIICNDPDALKELEHNIVASTGNSRSRAARTCRPTVADAANGDFASGGGAGGGSSSEKKEEYAHDDTMMLCPMTEFRRGESDESAFRLFDEADLEADEFNDDEMTAEKTAKAMKEDATKKTSADQEGQRDATSNEAKTASEGTSFSEFHVSIQQLQVKYKSKIQSMHKGILKELQFLQQIFLESKINRMHMSQTLVSQVQTLGAEKQQQKEKMMKKRKLCPMDEMQHHPQHQQKVPEGSQQQQPGLPLFDVGAMEDDVAATVLGEIVGCVVPVQAKKQHQNEKRMKKRKLCPMGEMQQPQLQQPQKQKTPKGPQQQQPEVPLFDIEEMEEDVAALVPDDVVDYVVPVSDEVVDYCVALSDEVADCGVGRVQEEVVGCALVSDDIMNCGVGAPDSTLDEHHQQHGGYNDYDDSIIPPFSSTLIDQAITEVFVGQAFADISQVEAV